MLQCEEGNIVPLYLLSILSINLFYDIWELLLFNDCENLITLFYVKNILYTIELCISPVQLNTTYNP